MIVAIIQARMGSTRLPGKILMEVDGTPLLGYQVQRVKKARLLDKVIVATSDLPADDIVARYCGENGIECFRGSESDVLSRYYDCARALKAEVIVRLTGDCPFSDPQIIDDLVRLYQETGVDYAANTVPPETSTFPDGSDVEIFSRQALERAHREAQFPQDREHVTFYFWKEDHGFSTVQLQGEKNLAGYRFTVDYPEDFEVASYVIHELTKRGSFGHLAEIIEIIDANPEVKMKNGKYFFGIGWQGQDGKLS